MYNLTDLANDVFKLHQKLLANTAMKLAQNTCCML